MVDTEIIGRRATYLIKDKKMDVDWILISVINDALKKISCFDVKILSEKVKEGIEITATTYEDEQ